MSGAASVGRRVWGSFVGVRVPHAPRGTRGREGYRLRQRFWASFIGVDLPPATAPRRPETVPRMSHRRELRGEPGWYALAPFPAVGGVTAAGDDAMVLEESSPDGLARFLVHGHRGDGSGFSLEVVLRGVDADGPLMCVVRYTRADGREQVLLVPVARARFGPSASYVHLPGFTAETAWAASGPVEVAEDAAWAAETVADSVRAARNEATHEGWRQVRELVGDRLRGIIDEELA